MALYSLTMKKGVTVAFDRTTNGCIGGGVGLCLGDTYKPNREFMENLLSEEEGYFKTRSLVREFLDDFPYVDIPQNYVVFKPLDQIDENRENPVLVSIPANERNTQPAECYNFTAVDFDAFRTSSACTS